MASKVDRENGDTVITLPPGEFHALVMALRHFVTDYEEGNQSTVLINAYNVWKAIK